jgi:hypothetical protein
MLRYDDDPLPRVSEIEHAGSLYWVIDDPPLPIPRGLCACGRPEPLEEYVLPYLGNEYYFDCPIYKHLIKLHTEGIPDGMRVDAQHAELFSRDAVKARLAEVRVDLRQRQRECPWAYGIPWGRDLRRELHGVSAEPARPDWDRITNLPIYYDCNGLAWSPDPDENLPRREMDSDGYIEWE